MSRTRKFRLLPMLHREITQARMDNRVVRYAREQFAQELAAALDEAQAEPEPSDPPLMELMS